MITIRTIVENKNTKIEVPKITIKEFKEAIEKISKTKKTNHICLDKINKEDNSMVH